MKLLLLASTGGALGAGLRHLVNAGFGRWLGVNFPCATLTVNVAGCLAMGLLAAVLAARAGQSPEVRVFLATGVLGGFTTFSAFSLDFAGLVTREETLAATLYLCASVVFSILAFFAGEALGRMLLE